MPKISPFPRFLPSYVGSKTRWLPRLTGLAGRPIVELFAGSAVISSAFASRALLVDTDPQIANVLSRFDELEVPEEFTRDDFYRVRSEPDWWRHAYNLQSLAFSGVYRHSKNGYNVSAKGGRDTSKNKVNTFFNRPSYEAALDRWRDLQPDVRNCSYLDITDEDIAALGDPVIILDPPYGDGETQKSQAPYNDSASAKKNGMGFDFDAYWARAEELMERYDCVVFDRKSNLESQGLEVDAARKMRVNGSRPGDVEGVHISRRGGKPFLSIGKYELAA